MPAEETVLVGYYRPEKLTVRLRERIKTHIEVRRNGHDPSTVRVVS